MIENVEKIKPLYDQLLVKRVEEESKTAGGIIIPDNAKESGQVGIVVRTGEGRFVGGTVTKLKVKEGDKVVFKKYSGTQVFHKDYLMLKEDDVLAIIEQ